MGLKGKESNTDAPFIRKVSQYSRPFPIYWENRARLVLYYRAAGIQNSPGSVITVNVDQNRE